MLQTMTGSMYDQKVFGNVSSNGFDFANKTQEQLNAVQSGAVNISNIDDGLHKSFTVFEEVDHSKKSMIQFLTKVGSIQDLQKMTDYNRI